MGRRRRGPRLWDLLPEDVFADLMRMRALCGLFAAIRDGRETIGEP